MELTYFNYTVHRAESRWDRRRFLHRWWQLQHDDTRWTPPFYPRLRQALNPTHALALDPRRAVPVHLEALARRQQRTESHAGLGYGGAFMEEPVATALLLAPHQETGMAYLTLLHCVNNSETLERLVGEVMEQAWALGCHRVVGPTALSLYLPIGALHNYFHVTPPLHTPYNPPYLPELLGEVLEPLSETRLYQMLVPPEVPLGKSPNLRLRPFDPTRLASDLLPLFVATQDEESEWPPPTAADVLFLLSWLQQWPLYGWLAETAQQPVGFTLLQPDLATSVRHANGGRNPLWRLWLNWRSRRPTRAGRLLYGAVLPAWRGQGIGRLLWQQALHTARSQDWATLTAGPVSADSPAAQFLTAQGAEAQQRYVLYGGPG
jgi:GNAT superfamily N-acetyltransferase